MTTPQRGPLLAAEVHAGDDAPRLTGGRPTGLLSRWTPSGETARYRRLERWLLAAMVALVALHVGVLAYHLAMEIAFPYDLNYGEGYVLNDAVRLAHGEPIYVDLQQFPMVRSPYPPLFPLLWSLVVPLTGPALWPGRGLEGLALVGVGALVAFNALRTRCGAWPAVAGVRLVPAFP